MSHSHSTISDMNMDSSSTSSSMGMMTMYFHGTTGTDTLWFSSWVPSSPGAIAGACIGLFMLAIFGALLRAVQRGAEVWFRKDALRRIASSQPLPFPARPTSTTSSTTSTTDESKTDEKSPALSNVPFAGPSAPQYEAEVIPTGRVMGMSGGEQAGGKGKRGLRGLPFVWRNEIARGALEVVSMAIQYLLMLVVMTFNIWFIISILAGHGVGTVLFGRHGQGRQGDH